MSSNRKANFGLLGEQVVALWLESQGWEILHRRWHCRWGELDAIARREDAIAFVEVKTRSRGNWDEGGLLAVTPQKQAKLWQAAELFLAEYPDLAVLPCRFDLALVSCKRSRLTLQDSLPVVALGQPFVLSGYELILHQYIESIISN
jgi:putative endonuclease